MTQKFHDFGRVAISCQENFANLVIEDNLSFNIRKLNENRKTFPAHEYLLFYSIMSILVVKGNPLCPLSYFWNTLRERSLFMATGGAVELGGGQKFECKHFEGGGKI